MQRALVDMSKFCSMYTNNIFSLLWECWQAQWTLHKVFSYLCEVGLKLHRQNCVLSCPEVPYLGYVISAEGILPNLDKHMVVKEFPTPANVRAVKEFLGLPSYYWLFVLGFTKEAEPLHMFTGPNVSFVGSES